MAISSVGAQVCIPGISDVNISKRALNFLVIDLSLFDLKFLDTESLIPTGGTAQGITAYTRLRSLLVSSVRVCMSRLESKRHSIQSSYLQQRLSISHLDARTGFLESLSKLQLVRTESYCNDAHMFIQELLHELGHDRSGGRLERRDPRAESAVNRLYVPRSTRCPSMLCTCIYRTQVCRINHHSNPPPLFSRIAQTSNDAFPHA